MEASRYARALRVSAVHVGRTMGMRVGRSCPAGLPRRRGLRLLLLCLARHSAASTPPPRRETLMNQCNTWCNKWTCGQSAECGACQVCMPSPPPAPLAGRNPFSGVDFLVPAHYSENVQRSVAAAGGASNTLGAQLSHAAGIPTAVWLDEIAALSKMRAALEQAQAQQRGTGVDTLCVFVVYDLPGRDCSAASSAGELRVGELDRYEDEFISAIKDLAMDFPEVPKVFVIEPDSLPNVVTNMGRPKCAMVAEDYKNGIAIAIRHLGPLGAIYVDVGWSGWIGTWSAPSMARLLGDVFELAGTATQYVRGFVTNVSNYGSNAAEAAYALALRTALAAAGYGNLAFIVDTGRNGAGQALGTWCNPKGAGMGTPPMANPSAAYCDAYYWIKPPGESDGVSLSSAPRFDPECAKGAAMSGAPQAGEWFNEQFLQLVQHASPPLHKAPAYVSEPRPHRPPIPPISPPAPKPPPSPPEPVSDDDFFESQRSEWLHSDAHLAIDRPQLPYTQRHRSPPPPSPRPPLRVASPHPVVAQGVEGPSAWSVAAASFVAVLFIVSFIFRGRAAGRTSTGSAKPTRKAPFQTPSLPPHILQRAREARYAQVEQSSGSAETIGSASGEDEYEGGAEAARPEPRPSRRGRLSKEAPEPRSGGDDVSPSPSEDATKTEPATPVLDANTVLDEARAMAERLQKVQERAQLERELERLNARVASLDAEIGRRQERSSHGSSGHGPNAEEVEAALSGLKARIDTVSTSGWHRGK